MHKRILVISDRATGLWLEKAAPRCDDHFAVLALGLNGESVWYLNQNKFDRIKSWEIVNLNAVAEAAQEKIRQFIPDFIYRFPKKEYSPGKNILRLFRLGKVNLWWFNKMSEKGAWGTRLIKRIYYIELIRRVFQRSSYQEIWVDLDDCLIVDALRKNQNQLCPIKIIGQVNKKTKLGFFEFWRKLLLNNFLFQGFYLLRWWAIKGLRLTGIDKIDPKAVLFFTFYPFFWTKPARFGRKELFFQDLPGKLKNKVPVYYATWLSLGLKEMWKNRKPIACDLKRLNMVMLESYLSFKDFILVFVDAINYVIKALVFSFAIYPKLKERFADLDVTNIVVDEFKRGFSSAEVITCLVMVRALRAAVRRTVPRALIYRVEFQPHERALIYATLGCCQTIAFQHQAIARNHLQYFFPREEMVAYYASKPYPDNLPLSNYYLVAGTYPFTTLKNDGFPEDVLAICGPVRYAGLVEYIKKRETKLALRHKYGFGERENIFFLASPVTREEVISLLLALLPALKEIQPEVLILIKSHPVVKFDDDIVQMINKILPTLKYKILSDDINTNDYLSLSDALILSGTTLGIEAICLGVLPLLFENYSTFSLNPLLEIKDACLCIKNAEEFKRAILAVVEKDEKTMAVRRHWPEAIRKLFYDIETDAGARFVEILQEKGVLP
jgi:surface carbohydrate biosynthesis protein (TIGR04326 family)